jgi:hypothetical protein
VKKLFSKPLPVVGAEQLQKIETGYPLRSSISNSETAKAKSSSRSFALLTKAAKAQRQAEALSVLTST